MQPFRSLTILAGLMLILLLSVNLTLAQDDTTRADGWDDYSHSNDTDPDYAVVFPQAAVNTITITIDPLTWRIMQQDMTNLYGEFGTRVDRRGQNTGTNQPPANGEPPAGFDPNQSPPDMGQRLPGGMGGNVNFVEENPIWVPVEISFNDQTWTNVGMRYKGNSSLSGTWSNASLKLPFRLDFDQFEDDYPEINNQRFYGFKALSFSNNFRDESYLREKIAADIFREAGITSAQTAFYAIYIDHGAGPVYYGLYTAVEMIDDTVIDTQFSDNSGNLYKPEGTGATFQAGTFNEEAFDKETNEEEADYSDILALFDALHAETRTTDPSAWRTNLEVVLDVDEFMHWLAVNTVILNWDSYGLMSHNYLLYNDPATGLLTWIPWDNNEALSERGAINGGLLDLDTINDNWPLIRYLMDDPVYHQLYVNYVEDTINGAFEPEKMTATYQTLHDLIAPYVLGSDTNPADMHLTSAESFENSLTQLISHVNKRYATAQAYLDTQSTE